ncbi:MAG: RNA polymerase subunit sigma-24 [Armatimonadetes bacterium JP3_11]|jgi:RNA polymerase sigma-70 factor (ECF subfamily)|nr:MAG: RNA polymerase subunit sigma-24 [Armatimonadetes bacterium CP1_7O]OYT75508.1 MAG: RNA polymerase subunit sigma-24 [Armatimonadetes bacterium JP3_11]RMH07875.1 MAG: sigma-70 family RNA polymerase sigma factor [Armatimonadota bacterium]
MMEDTHLIEADLIEAAKQGDDRAFDRLWARHRDKVFRSLLKACGGDPETTHDVLQDALLNAFRALQQFRGDANFATWLYTIARRLCIRARRDLDRFYSLDDPLNSEEGRAILRQLLDQYSQDPEAIAIENDLRERVQQAVAELPDSLRPVLQLRDIEGLSTEETAEKLGLTQAAVKARLHRARELLRQKLEAYLRQE